MGPDSHLHAVLLVDDDADARTAMRFYLEGRGFTVGEAADGEEALARAHELRPALVLMDINMPGMNGIECASRVRTAYPQVEIIMLTVYQDADNVMRSLAAGANGYLLKRATRDDLLAAIHQVLAGGSPMSSQIARKVVQAFRQPASVENETNKLSAREQEVLALLAKGFLYKEIAMQLNIGYDTVHNYIRRIYEKLRVRSRGQAVAKYFERSSSPRFPTV